MPIGIGERRRLLSGIGFGVCDAAAAHGGHSRCDLQGPDLTIRARLPAAFFCAPSEPISRRPCALTHTSILASFALWKSGRVVAESEMGAVSQDGDQGKRRAISFLAPQRRI